MAEDGTLDLNCEEWFHLVNPRAIRDASSRALARVWRDSGGEDIPYEKISNLHLANILLLLRRKSQETAQFAASKQHLTLSSAGWTLRKHPQWDSLIEEAKGRGSRMATIATLLESRPEPGAAFIRAAIPRP